MQVRAALASPPSPVNPPRCRQHTTNNKSRFPPRTVLGHHPPPPRHRRLGREHLPAHRRRGRLHHDGDADAVPRAGLRGEQPVAEAAVQLCADRAGRGQLRRRDPALPRAPAHLLQGPARPGRDGLLRHRVSQLWLHGRPGRHRGPDHEQ